MLSHPRSPRRLLALTAAAVLAATALAGTAIAAASFTLKVAKHAEVTSVTTQVTTHPNVVVTAKGMVVYTLSGDSRKHPECTKGNGCFQFWPPVTAKSVKAASKAAGVKGRLGTWKRNGLVFI